MQIWHQINLLILESDFARLYAGLNSRNALREYLKTSNCDNIFTGKKKKGSEFVKKILAI